MYLKPSGKRYRKIQGNVDSTATFGLVSVRVLDLLKSLPEDLASRYKRRAADAGNTRFILASQR